AGPYAAWRERPFSTMRTETQAESGLAPASAGNGLRAVPRASRRVNRAIDVFGPLAGRLATIKRRGNRTGVRRDRRDDNAEHLCVLSDLLFDFFPPISKRLLCKATPIKSRRRLSRQWSGGLATSPVACFPPKVSPSCQRKRRWPGP